MSTCAQTLQASQRALEDTPGTLPLVLSHQGTLSLISNRGRRGLGLSDDPDVLVEDVLCDALLLQEYPPPPVSRYSCVSASDLHRPSGVRGGKSGLPACAGKPVGAKAAVNWIALILHRLHMEAECSEPCVIVKTNSFAKRLEHEDLQNETGLLIPFEATTAVVHLVVEVWSNYKKNAKGSLRKTRSCYMFSFAGCIVGIVKIGIPMTSGDSTPKHALYTITGLDGEAKGSMEMSFWRNTERQATQQMKYIHEDHSARIPAREQRLRQQPSKETEQSGRGAAQTDIGPSNRATASKKSNELAKADDKKAEGSVQCQEDSASITKEPTSKEIVQIRVLALKLSTPMHRTPSETKAVSSDFPSPSFRPRSHLFLGKTG